jgi:DNA polymerase III sliding clamp (beta) subunit (PCNA family)
MNMDTDTMTGTITIAARDFADAVKVVAASAGTDKSLPMLTYLQLSGGGDKPLELVATDRFRLTVATLKGLRVGQGGEITPLLIPAAPLAKFLTGLKLPKFTREWDIITLTVGAGDVVVHAAIADEVSSVTLRLSDTKFPDYSSLGLDPTSERYTGAAANLIGVNPKLLGEVSAALSKITGKNTPVKLHLPNEATRPILLTLDTESVGYLSVLMPMRVN